MWTDWFFIDYYYYFPVFWSVDNFLLLSTYSIFPEGLNSFLLISVDKWGKFLGYSQSLSTLSTDYSQGYQAGLFSIVIILSSMFLTEGSFLDFIMFLQAFMTVV